MNLPLSWNSKKIRINFCIFKCLNLKKKKKVYSDIHKNHTNFIPRFDFFLIVSSYIFVRCTPRSHVKKQCKFGFQP